MSVIRLELGIVLCLHILIIAGCGNSSARVDGARRSILSKDKETAKLLNSDKPAIWLDNKNGAWKFAKYLIRKRAKHPETIFYGRWQTAERCVSEIDGEYDISCFIYSKNDWGQIVRIDVLITAKYVGFFPLGGWKTVSFEPLFTEKIMSREDKKRVLELYQVYDTWEELFIGE